MAVYEVQKDGKTYEVDAPNLAAAAAAFDSPAPKKSEAPGWGEAAMSAIPSAIGQIGTGIVDAGKLAASLIGGPDPEAVKQDAQAGRFMPYEVAKSVAAIPGGMAQAVRNLSPEEFRGSAPEMAGGEPEKHRWIQAAAGDTAPLRQDIAERPLSVVADVLGPLFGAGAVTKTGQAMIGRGAEVVMTPGRKLASSLKNFQGARRAEDAAVPIADDLRRSVGPLSIAPEVAAENAAIREAFDMRQSAWAASSDAQNAAKEADKQARIVRGLRTTQRGMGAPSINDIGVPTTPTNLGAPLQAAALKNQERIIAERGKLDSELRNARTQIVQSNEAAGKTIEGTEAYKELVDTLKPIVSDIDPVTAPAIARSTDPSVKKLYQRVWDTVVSKEIPLTAEQAAVAKKNGIAVSARKTPEGTQYFRKQAASFDAVDDARRFLGKVFSGNPPDGYEAISAVHQKDLYRLLDNVQSEYVAGVPHRALQENWKSAAKNLEVFDTKAGKTLTATQGDTEALRTNAADIPGQFLGKGLDRYQQLVDVTAAPDLAKTSAGNWMATALQGKTGAQAKAALAPASKIADMLQHPELAPVRKSASDYAAGLRRYERGADRLEGEAGNLTKAQAEAIKAKDKARKAQDEVIKAGERTSRAAQDTAAAERAAYARTQKYERLEPREVVSSAKSDAAADFKSGRITKDQFDSINQQIDEAVRLFGQTDKAKERIKKIKTGALIAAGALGVGASIRQGANYAMGN